MSSEEHFCLAIVGDGSTGKSSIINAFKSEGFMPVYKQTVGIEFYEKKLQIRGDQHVSLRIWDVGGQSIHSKNLEQYVTNSHVLYLVYDVTNMESFLNMDDWLRKVRSYAKPGTKLYLVGNKIDLYNMRLVNEAKHKQFVEENNLTGGLFMSARTGENITKAFYQVAGELIGIHLSTYELAFFDKVLKAHVDRENDPNEGRTNVADDIEAEDARLEQMKREREAGGKCNCVLS
jgi:Ras-related protein Rab-28